MQLRQTALSGVRVLDIEPAMDERGFFARTFCADMFTASGLVSDFPQCSVSFNGRRGTLRGLHLQCEPHGEAKLVRCTAGAIFDVAVDLRRQSPTFGRWAAAELTARNRRAFYIPVGCAHGFITLTGDTEVFYQISRRHVPAASRGLRWDDPDLAIAWPLMPEVISARDAALPRLREWPDERMLTAAT
jgi:dTDP-4-dehydrorhamnose 3,5-epimerase